MYIFNGIAWEVPMQVSPLLISAAVEAIASRHHLQCKSNIFRVLNTEDGADD